MQISGKQQQASGSKVMESNAGKHDEPISPWPRRILLACDGSSHAAKAANIVAAMATPASQVRVITVQSYEFATYTGEWGPLSDEEERQERLKAIIDQVFHQPIALLERSACEVQKKSRLGNPAEQILEEIDDWHPDLLVVGRAGLGGMSRLLLGSVSAHLVKHSKVPVLVVP